MEKSTNPESATVPTMTFTMKTTREGLLSQHCPACFRQFKARPSDDHPVMYCPYCAEAGKGRFWTAAQQEFRQACAKYVLTRMLFKAAKPEPPVSPDEPEDTMAVLAVACCKLTVKHDGRSIELRCPYCGTAAG